MANRPKTSPRIDRTPEICAKRFDSVRSPPHHRVQSAGNAVSRVKTPFETPLLAARVQEAPSASSRSDTHPKPAMMTARRRNPLSRCAAALVASLAIGTGPMVNCASAEILLAEYDVFNDTGDWSVDEFVSNYIIAETFIPTITGTVASVQVAVSKSGETTIPLSWTIRSTYESAVNGLQPDLSPAGALSVGTLAANDCPTSRTGWISVPMTPVDLEMGQNYALVGTAIGTNSIYRWWNKTNTTDYIGRHLVGYYTEPQLELGSGSDDVGFRIIAVPEPSCVPLLLLGALAGCAGVVRRRA